MVTRLFVFLLIFSLSLGGYSQSFAPFNIDWSQSPSYIPKGQTILPFCYDLSSPLCMKQWTNYATPLSVYGGNPTPSSQYYLPSFVIRRQITNTYINDDDWSPLIPVSRFSSDRYDDDFSPKDPFRNTPNRGSRVTPRAPQPTTSNQSPTKQVDKPQNVSEENGAEVARQLRENKEALDAARVELEKQIQIAKRREKEAEAAEAKRREAEAQVEKAKAEVERIKEISDAEAKQAEAAETKRREAEAQVEKARAESLAITKEAQAEAERIKEIADAEAKQAEAAETKRQKAEAQVEKAKAEALAITEKAQAEAERIKKIADAEAKAG